MTTLTRPHGSESTARYSYSMNPNHFHGVDRSRESGRDTMRRNLRQADPRLRHATFQPKRSHTPWIKEIAKGVEEFRWYFLIPVIGALIVLMAGDSAAVRTVWLQVLGVFTLASTLVWLIRGVRLGIHRRLRSRLASAIAHMKGRP